MASAVSEPTVTTTARSPVAALSIADARVALVAGSTRVAVTPIRPAVDWIPAQVRPAGVASLGSPKEATSVIDLTSCGVGLGDGVIAAGVESPRPEPEGAAGVGPLEKKPQPATDAVNATKTAARPTMRPPAAVLRLSSPGSPEGDVRFRFVSSCGGRVGDCTIVQPLQRVVQPTRLLGVSTRRVAFGNAPVS